MVEAYPLVVPLTPLEPPVVPTQTTVDAGVATAAEARLTAINTTYRVLLIPAEGEEGDEARRHFARRYWGPVLAYLTVIARKRDPARARALAEEIAGAFWDDKILSDKLLRSYDRSQGRFSIYLKKALGHYVINKVWRISKVDAGAVSLDATGGALATPARARTPARGMPKAAESDRLVPDAMHLLDTAEETDANGLYEAEREYTRVWTAELVDEALARVTATARDALAVELFRAHSFGVDGGPPLNWAEMYEVFHIRDEAARRRARPVKAALRDAVRTVLAERLQNPDDVDEELKELGLLL